MKEAQKHVQEWYRSTFALFEKSLNGESSGVFHRLRTEALTAFGALGFPSTKEEEWKFTNVDPIASTQFQPVFQKATEELTRKDLQPFLLPGTDAVRMVFLNGLYSERLSNAGKAIAGLKAESLAKAMKKADPILEAILGRQVKSDLNGFTALNAAFLRDGALLSVAPNTVVEHPVHLLFVSTRSDQPLAIHPRIVVSAGKNSRLTLVESYVSLAESVHLTNAVVEVLLEEDAVVEHDKLQQESERGYHIWTAYIKQEARSAYISNSISLGGSIVRNTLTAELGGEGIETTLNGLSLGTGHQVVDNHTTIDHARPNCASHELYKAILDGRSRGVFNGKIFVRKDAQKTDAKQTNQTLLLSDDATIDTKPQLEIFADDVKCTHGATVGQLDQEQVFYLTSRGIGLEAARDILTFAFAQDVVSRIHVEGVRNQLEPLLHAKLDRARRIENSPA